MAVDSRVQELLDQICDSGCTPEDVCAACPEVLPEFRRRWLQICAVKAELHALFPTPGPDPRPGADAPVPRHTGADLPQIPGYAVEALLGRGGMGLVYKARHLRLERLVALKFLPREFAQDPQRLELLRCEARTASTLNHPHICTIYDLDEHEGQPFLVMELIEGRTLRALAAQRPSLATLVHLLGQVAKALAAAHAAGIMHRDIKPENIMVRDDGYAKVIDFGLSRPIPTYGRPSAASADEFTVPGTVLGTARYMSPEQARAETASSASDLFSLGVVLYELVTGQHPFPADSPRGTLHAVQSQPPLRPSLRNPKIPAALEALIVQMLQKEPRLRPTAAEVDAALTELTGRGARWNADGLMRATSAKPSTRNGRSKLRRSQSIASAIRRAWPPRKRSGARAALALP
jgi:eukaryotic-like serine/threonine-protein kinase